MSTKLLNATEPVLACNMAAISADQREGHIETTRQLLAAVDTIEELSEGYAWHLPNEEDNLARAVQFIALERLCCPFLSFALELQAGATSFQLRFGGPPGIKPFLMTELGAAFPDPAKPA